MTPAPVAGFSHQRVGDHDVRLRLGISACLLGAPVRFDGGHKRDPFLMDSLGPYVEWVPVCPEDQCGLGTPRESMRLVKIGEGTRLVTVRSGRDLTDLMESYAHTAVERLAAADLNGFVLKKDSLSCGLERVKVYDGSMQSRTGRGLFASRLIARLPLLPVEEEGRLSDPRLRENFVARVYAYKRLRAHFAERWSLGTLVRFHTSHKLILMAHSPLAYQQLGRVVAESASMARDQLQQHYSAPFMAALSHMATRGRHANVLQHMAGYLKDRLPRECRSEVSTTIHEYRRGLVPLVVPMTLLTHHIRVRPVPYLAGQVYLQPHPRELGLRNYV